MLRDRTKLGGAAFLAILVWPASSTADVADFLRGVGRTLGAPFGGFVESMVTPSLRAGERTGKELVADVDRRMDERIRQVGSTSETVLRQVDSIAATRIGQVDHVVSARLTQADAMLAARITQIDTSAAQLVDRSIGKLDGTVQRAIKGLGGEVNRAIVQLDAAGTRRLQQADEILESRIEQLGSTVNQSIVAADQALETRLGQVDEITERRLGNLDVIGTRQVLGAESALTRLAVLGAVLGLIVIFLRSLGTEIWERWEETDDGKSQFGGRVRSMLNPQLLLGVTRVLLAHLAIAGICIGLVLLVARRLPHQTEQHVSQLVATHRAAMENSVIGLDHRRALYFASQLVILDPTRSREYDLSAEKIRVLRDVLLRPGLIERPDAVRLAARQISQLNAQLGRADRDLLTLQCYLRWQLARTRMDEQSAAADCQRALITAAPGSFWLRPLAEHYVAAFTVFPSWSAAQSSAWDRASEAREALPGLEHIFSFSGLVSALDRDSTRAYLAMLEAHAAYDQARRGLPAKQKAFACGAASASRLSPEQRLVCAAMERRADQARQVVDAWRVFDQALQSDAWLPGSSSELAAFLLNDAILSRALIVASRPELVLSALRVSELPDATHRAEAAPLRIEWMRRYLGGLGEHASRLVSYEESRRFLEYEARAVQFEKAYLAHAASAAPSPEQIFALALAAAQLGLYIDVGGRRVPYAQTLPVSPERSAELKQAMDARHVRLL